MAEELSTYLDSKMQLNEIHIDPEDTNVKKVLKIIIESKHKILNFSNVCFEIELFNSYKGPLRSFKHNDESLELANQLKFDDSLRSLYVCRFLHRIKNFLKNMKPEYSSDIMYLSALHNIRWELIAQGVIINSMKNTDDTKVTMLSELSRTKKGEEEKSLLSYLYESSIFEPYLLKEIFHMSDYLYPEIIGVSYCPNALEIGHEIKHEEIMTIVHDLYSSVKDKIHEPKRHGPKIYHISYLGKIFHFYSPESYSRPIYLTESSMGLSLTSSASNKFKYTQSSPEVISYLTRYISIGANSILSAWMAFS